MDLIFLANPKILPTRGSAYYGLLPPIRFLTNKRDIHFGQECQEVYGMLDPSNAQGLTDDFFGEGELLAGSGSCDAEILVVSVGASVSRYSYFLLPVLDAWVLSSCLALGFGKGREGTIAEHWTSPNEVGLPVRMRSSLV